MQQADWTDRAPGERVRESARYGVCMFLALAATYAIYFRLFIAPTRDEPTSVFEGLVNAFPILVMLTVFAAWLWYLYASAFRAPSIRRLVVLGIAALAGFPVTLWAYQTYLQFQTDLAPSDNLMLSLFSLATLVPVMVVGAAVTLGFARWTRGQSLEDPD